MNCYCVKSDWMELETGLPTDRQVFAIGDIHGCLPQMQLLIRQFEEELSDSMHSTLVLLGDLVDRGRNSVGVIDEAIGSAKLGFSKTACLMGNHEQMLRLTLDGSVGRRYGGFSADVWLWNGAGAILENLSFPDPYRLGMEAREYGKELALALGDNRTKFIAGLDSHLAVGSMIFVHAGLDPRRSLDAHFSTPWDDFGSPNHWAWIREPFLNYPVHVPGLTVVHGHTPVGTLNKFFRSFPVPRETGAHHLDDGKINLDSGSFATGQVASAHFKEGCYRVLLAVTA